MAKPGSDGSEDCVADRGTHYSRSWLAEADGKLCAIDKLDIELGHVADTQGHIGVEVGVPHLTLNKLGSFVQCHTETPKGAWRVTSVAMQPRWPLALM